MLLCKGALIAVGYSIDHSAKKFMVLWEKITEATFSNKFGLFWMNYYHGEAELQVFSVNFQNRYKKSIKEFYFALKHRKNSELLVLLWKASQNTPNIITAARMNFKLYLAHNHCNWLHFKEFSIFLFPLSFFFLLFRRQASSPLNVGIPENILTWPIEHYVNYSY